MPNDSFAASIAQQRQRTYLDQAERHRQAQSFRAASAPRRESLLRTALVRVRPIRPSDAGLLEDAFERLSLESRQFRFLFPKGALSPSELRYFTNVDHHDHEALVAVHRLDSRGLGVARYIRHRNDPQAADVAVTVIDEWHGPWAGHPTRDAADGTRAVRGRFTLHGDGRLRQQPCPQTAAGSRPRSDAPGLRRWRRGVRGRSRTGRCPHGVATFPGVEAQPVLLRLKVPDRRSVDTLLIRSTDRRASTSNPTAWGQ